MSAASPLSVGQTVFCSLRRFQDWQCYLSAFRVLDSERLRRQTEKEDVTSFWWQPATEHRLRLLVQPLYGRCPPVASQPFPFSLSDLEAVQSLLSHLLPWLKLEGGGVSDAVVAYELLSRHRVDCLRSTPLSPPASALTERGAASSSSSSSAFVSSSSVPVALWTPTLAACYRLLPRYADTLSYFVAFRCLDEERLVVRKDSAEFWSQEATLQRLLGLLHSQYPTAASPPPVRSLPLPFSVSQLSSVQSAVSLLIEQLRQAGHAVGRDVAYGLLRANKLGLPWQQQPDISRPLPCAQRSARPAEQDATMQSSVSLPSPPLSPLSSAPASSCSSSSSPPCTEPAAAAVSEDELEGKYGSSSAAGTDFDIPLALSRVTAALQQDAALKAALRDSEQRLMDKALLVAELQSALSQQERKATELTVHALETARAEWEKTLQTALALHEQRAREQQAQAVEAAGRLREAAAAGLPELEDWQRRGERAEARLQQLQQTQQELERLREQERQQQEAERHQEQSAREQSIDALKAARLEWETAAAQLRDDMRDWQPHGEEADARLQQTQRELRELQQLERKQELLGWQRRSSEAKEALQQLRDELCAAQQAKEEAVRRLQQEAAVQQSTLAALQAEMQRMQANQHQLESESEQRQSEREQAAAALETRRQQSEAVAAQLRAELGDWQRRGEEAEARLQQQQQQQARADEQGQLRHVEERLHRLLQRWRQEKEHRRRKKEEQRIRRQQRTDGQQQRSSGSQDKRPHGGTHSRRKAQRVKQTEAAAIKLEEEKLTQDGAPRGGEEKAAAVPHSSTLAATPVSVPVSVPLPQPAVSVSSALPAESRLPAVLPKRRRRARQG